MIPRLHVVTDDEVLERSDFIRRARGILEAGGEAVALHVRGPRSPGALILEHARTLQDVARATGGRLFVNDRVDVARALALDGVHLGGHSLPVAAARALLGPSPRIGRSTHSVEDAAAAERDGADYLIVGTIYPTPSHPGRSGSGPERLASVARQCGLPLVAIGGIDLRRAGEVSGLPGRPGVAVLRGIWNAIDPAEATQQYLEAIGRD